MDQVDGGLPDTSVPDVDVSDELAEYIRDNDVTILAMGDDGVEYGQNETGTDGWARFYSPVHEGLVEFEMSSDDESPTLVGDLPVILALTSEREAVWAAVDPTETYEPVLHSITVPETGEHEMDLDMNEVSERLDIDYDPEAAEDPFGEDAEKDAVGSITQPLLVGVVVTFAIRSTLTSLAVGAVASIFGNLVRGACNFATPLYAERCEIIGNIAESAVKLFAGVRLGNVSSWGDFAREVGGEALEVADINCESVSASLVGLITDITPDDTAPIRELAFRRVLQKWNYLLHQMETDPQPGQQSWEWAQEQSLALIAARHGVLEEYFVAMSAEENPPEDGMLMGIFKSAVEKFVEGSEVTVITAARDAVTENNQIFYDFARDLDGDGAVDDVDGVVMSYKYTTSPTRLTNVSEGFERLKAVYETLNCAWTFVTTVDAAFEQDGRAERIDDLIVQELVDDGIAALDAAITAEYRRFWGELPMGECLADIMEPNDTWQLAHASPVPGTLGAGGGDVATLERLNLCDGLGMSGDDVDWYAYNNPAIDFRVQARFFQPPGAAGDTESVCVDVHFYSDIYELAGTPPDVLRTQCGVGDFSTDEFGVRRTIGERWSQILLRVRPENPEDAMPVDYNLRFN